MDGSTKHLNKSQYSVYTDGSKINGQVGSGFIVMKSIKVIHYANDGLSDHTTVFQAEIHALHQAGK